MKASHNAQMKVTADDALAALDARLEALRAEDSRLLAEQLLLEKATLPEAPGGAVDDTSAAVVLLNGSAPKGMAGAASKGVRLYQVIERRRHIACALDIGGREQLRQIIRRVDIVLHASAEQWKGITKERALALVQLMAANKKAEEFRRTTIDEARTMIQLPCDAYGRSPFDSGDANVTAFLEMCVSEGILSRKDAQLAD